MELFTAATATSSASPNLFERIQQGWDSAVTGVGWFFTNLSPAFVFALLGMAIVVAFFVYYWYCLKPRANSLEWIAMSEAQSRRKSMSLTLPYTPMERCDWIPLVLVTVIYAITAFFQLGSMSAPESYVKFQQGDSYTFSFSQPVTPLRMTLPPWGRPEWFFCISSAVMNSTVVS